MARGDDLWKHTCQDVLIRVSKGTPEERARPDWPEKLIVAKEEHLQAVLDKAAREFADPSRPTTRPLTAELLSRFLASPPAKRTRGSS